MQLTVLKSKLHRATVTGADLNYEGSVSLGPELMEAALLAPYERVEIYNISNGERFATYVIKGERAEVCLNGAAAWKVRKGDKVIIASYGQVDQASALKHSPRVVMMEAGNQIADICDKV